MLYVRTAAHDQYCIYVSYIDMIFSRTVLSREKRVRKYNTIIEL